MKQQQQNVSSSAKRISPNSPYPVVLSPPSSLPNYLSLRGQSGSTTDKGTSTSTSPLMSSADGASNGPSEWEEDFVILCEFSELFGAIEIWHIPEEVELKNFNKEKFMSSIMSVDYQSGHEAGDTFRGDTSVAAMDPNSRHTYYAYHFTLLDIQARGYVRPLALVYVTRSTNVAMEHHTELSELFSETVKVLKRYNWVLTHRDIERRIADLEYTLAEVKRGSSAICENLSEAKVAGLRDRHRDLVKLKFKLDKLENAAASPAVPDEYLPHMEDVFTPQLIPYIPVLCTEEHKRRFDKSLRTVEELCGERPVDLAKYMISRIISRFFQTLPVIAEREMETASTEPQFGEELELSIGCGTVSINYGVSRKEPPKKHVPLRRSGRKGRNSAVISGPSQLPGGKATEGKEKRMAEGHDFGVKSSLSASHKPLASEDGESDNADDGGKESATTAEKKGDSKDGVSPYPPLEIGGYMMDEEPTHLWFFQEAMPGKGVSMGVYEFITGHSFSQALVYSLLRGRPVIIRARPDKRAVVEMYVDILSVFVAGMEGCVVPWHDTPLRLADFSRLRLVGVPRKPFIVPKAVERCATILNVDSVPETLVAPECPPDAEYVKRLLALDKYWSDEECYYAHIREELYNMGLWSSLYYNMCCVGTLKMSHSISSSAEERAIEEKIVREMSGEERGKAIEEALEEAMISAPSQKTVYVTAPLPLDVRETFKAQFCNDAKISWSDLAILENFAEVIKLQQAAAEPGAFLHVLPVRITDSQVLLFKNTVPATPAK